MTFPADYDTLTRVTADDYLDTAGKEGDVLLGQIQDAIEAIQAAIGKTGETAAGTIEARLAAIPAAVAAAVTAHEVAADPHGQYVTAAEVASLAPAETAATVGALIAGATAKATPADADLLGLSDSAASGVLKKLSWANLKAALTSVFSTPAAVAAAVTSHEGAADPHPQYTTAAEVASLAPAETTTTTGSLIAGATDKTTPVDGDLLGLVDSAASWITKKLSWANLKTAMLSAVFGAGYTRTVFHSAKPWILPSAGTLNAGAAGAATITGMTTALPRTYSGPGKIYVPAVGSWGGGWMDFLLATTTTVTLADAVATGGAYSMAALAGVDIVGPSYTLPASAIGPNGILEHEYNVSLNSSAGGKMLKVLAAGQAIAGGGSSWTTSVSARGIWYTAALGVENKQQITNNNGLIIYAATGSLMTANTTVDFTTDQTISIALKVAVANDILVLERLTERLTYGA